MKTLRVTLGAWVSQQAALVLDDAEHDRLRAGLEHDDAAQRAQALAALRQRLAQTPLEMAPGLVPGDCEIEALDFEPPRRAAVALGGVYVTMSQQAS